jgi:hypothetical protein
MAVMGRKLFIQLAGEEPLGVTSVKKWGNSAAVRIPSEVNEGNEGSDRFRIWPAGAKQTSSVVPRRYSQKDGGKN